VAALGIKTGLARRVRMAIKRVTLQTAKSAGDEPMKLALDEPLPENVEILPASEVLNGLRIVLGT
jgi:hypothetical protein